MIGWWLVKFEGKKTVKRFVGKVANIDAEGVQVKYTRRKSDSGFNWPLTDDITLVDETKSR